MVSFRFISCYKHIALSSILVLLLSGCFEIQYTEPDAAQDTSESSLESYLDAIPLSESQYPLYLKSLTDVKDLHPEGLSKNQSGTENRGVMIQLTALDTQYHRKSNTDENDLYKVKNKSFSHSTFKKYNGRNEISHRPPPLKNDKHYLIEWSRNKDLLNEKIENLKTANINKRDSLYNSISYWHKSAELRLKEWLSRIKTIKRLPEDNIKESGDKTSDLNTTINIDTDESTDNIKDSTKYMPEKTHEEELAVLDPELENNDEAIETIDDTNIPDEVIPVSKHPLFPDEYYCTDNVLLLAQAMSNEQLESTCEAIKNIEQTFHNTTGTQYEPVADSYNDTLEIRIFDSYSAYTKDIKSVSGLDYKPSGGFFYEGNLSKPNNKAKIYVFEKTYSRGIWNIEHEYVHYLNARYIKLGPVKNDSYYLFWEEGIAEYFSKGANNSDATVTLHQSDFSIHDVISIDTGSSQAEIYGWGYWLMRFLMEEKQSLFFELSFHLKKGNFSDYKKSLYFIAITYENEFQDWIKHPL